MNRWIKSPQIYIFLFGVSIRTFEVIAISVVKFLIIYTYSFWNGQMRRGPQKRGLPGNRPEARWAISPLLMCMPPKFLYLRKQIRMSTALLRFAVSCKFSDLLRNLERYFSNMATAMVRRFSCFQINKFECFYYICPFFCRCVVWRLYTVLCILIR